VNYFGGHMDEYNEVVKWWIRNELGEFFYFFFKGNELGEWCGSR